MKHLKYTGGARFSNSLLSNATWPLAKLIIQDDKLLLNITFVGKYEFTKDDIITIEKYVKIPFIAWGIKINHNVATYPETLIFWSMRNPQNIINQINLSDSFLNAYIKK
jgi:hypothetical protein